MAAASRGSPASRSSQTIAAAEAEPDDPELAIGHAPLELVEAGTHVLDEPLGWRVAEDAADRALVGDRAVPPSSDSRSIASAA